METLGTERYKTGPVDKKDIFNNPARMDSAYDSISGSHSDTSLLQSSLSSFATLSPNNSVADDTDVFSDATISDHDSDAASQVFSTPKQVVKKYPVKSNDTRTFYSFEEYHRSDTSPTGLIFLYMFLKKIPGREAEAEEVLQKYYNRGKLSGVVEPQISGKSTENITKSDKTGYKSDGDTTDDEVDQLSQLYKSKPRKKSKKQESVIGGDKSVRESKPLENEQITADKMTLVAKVDLPNDVKSVSIFRERTDTRPLKMMLETEKSNWSVFVEPDENSCKIQIHDRVDVNVQKSHKLEPNQNGTNRLTIDEKAWSKNQNFNGPKKIKIFTDADWSNGIEAKFDGENNLIADLPKNAREVKFQLDGAWTTLDCLPTVPNQGWNKNNLIF